MEKTSKIILGNCLEILKTLPSESIDSCITDPPYELGFMGKKWDSTGIAYNVELWKEVLRVLKAGGHLLAFSGTRTYHRMACAIEDAGFEVRDMIQWVYGSGFPKSLDISKQIDKMACAEREVIGSKTSGIANKEEGIRYTIGASKSIQVDITKPATFLPEKWQGWGTALKPAHEPIIIARKPLKEKTVAENVLKYGTGGINIDGCRVETDELTGRNNKIGSNIYGGGKGFPPIQVIGNSIGRFPANLIHDGSEEVIKEFPDVFDEMEDEYEPTKQKTLFNEIIDKKLINASKFFYCAKPSKDERNQGCENFKGKWVDDGKENKPQNRNSSERNNFHPTVKPIILMEYLIKLVTQPDGIVMDIFMGSGTTGCACARLGYNFIGIERDEEYIKLADARIKSYLNQQKLNQF